tara:strand:- start:259 stop:564 length:306 start_codon:yes stop_codon:yes gene_type:complete
VLDLVLLHHHLHHQQHLRVLLEIKLIYINQLHLHQQLLDYLNILRFLLLHYLQHKLRHRHHRYLHLNLEMHFHQHYLDHKFLLHQFLQRWHHRLILLLYHS